jgi:protein-S-isoprenylcysteine O-methyltransferase Ste14
MTGFPVFFLICLVLKGISFANKGINIKGQPPIEKYLYYPAKYGILLIWIAPVFQSINIDLRLLDLPDSIKTISVVLWAVGFSIMLKAFFFMDQSVRMGTPEEATGLVTGGLFKICRNPMYLGLFLTVIASLLYNINLIITICGIIVVLLHIKIINAEERILIEKFGNQYREYCQQVPKLIPRFFKL